MANSIIGIPTTRLSDLFMRDQLLTQLQSNQADLYKIQTQLSTGYSFQSISENPVAAMSVIGLQSLLQRKAQVQSNINTNQSYLSTTDSALTSVSDLLSQVLRQCRGSGGRYGHRRPDAARPHNRWNKLLQQLMDTGNQQFRGRYLFPGSENATGRHFNPWGKRVKSLGNEQQLVELSRSQSALRHQSKRQPGLREQFLRKFKGRLRSRRI